MISQRRGSTSSADDIEQDIDHETDIIAWDFDTSHSDGLGLSQTDDRDTSLFATVSDLSRSHPVSLDTAASNTPVPTPPMASTMPPHLEHPLEQLFSNDTIRSATVPAGLRPRKDTMPSSRPVSPLPPLPLPGATIQPTNTDSDYRSSPALGLPPYDLRLPEIPSSGPIQIEIPTPEETLRKDAPAPGVRSRSATITNRSARSDSTGSSGFPPRLARFNPLEPMPQPNSPPTSSRAASPKPQLPSPPSYPLQPASTNISKAPMSPPKNITTTQVIPPGSPPKGHISSKSLPNPGVTNGTPAPLPQDATFIKPRPAEMKPPRPPNLTLNVIYD
jgi:hypothetical protein